MCSAKFIFNFQKKYFETVTAANGHKKTVSNVIQVLWREALCVKMTSKYDNTIVW